MGSPGTEVPSVPGLGKVWGELGELGSRSRRRKGRQVILRMVLTLMRTGDADNQSISTIMDVRQSTMTGQMGQNVQVPLVQHELPLAVGVGRETEFFRPVSIT